MPQAAARARSKECKRGQACGESGPPAAREGTRGDQARPDGSPAVRPELDAEKPGESLEGRGVTAAALLERDGNRYGGLSARELERWPFDEGFAEREAPGVLVPTGLALEVGGLLAT